MGKKARNSRVALQCSHCLMVDFGLLGNLKMQITKMIMKKQKIVATTGTLAFKFTKLQRLE